MQTLYFEKTSELKRTKEELENKLDISIKIEGKKITINGSPLEEYEAFLVLDAMSFGFSAKKALSLKNENAIFRTINIKDCTKKKNLEEVRARVIGAKGKTKKTIENISNTDIIINNNEIGIIGSAESMDETITAMTNLIRGTKQSNTYRYLEKMNRMKNKDYGLG